MTSPRTENDARPDDEKPARLQLSPVQVAAGALAAVSSAVVLSLFGVAGTVIGAALASIVSTVGSALYSASLTSTSEKLRKAREQLATRPPVPAGEEPATRELPPSLDPRRAPAPRQRPRWARVAGYAAAVFVMGMAIVTGIELIGQQPVSALVGGTDESSSSTTIGELSNASSSRDTTEEPAGPTDPAEGTTTEAPASTTPADETPADDTGESATPTGETDESTPATESGSEGSGEGSGEESGSGDDAEETAPAAPTTQAPRTGAGTTAGPTG